MVFEVGRIMIFYYESMKQVLEERLPMYGCDCESHVTCMASWVLFYGQMTSNVTTYALVCMHVKVCVLSRVYAHLFVRHVQKIRVCALLSTMYVPVPE
jgi:hypothetical protein